MRAATLGAASATDRLLTICGPLLPAGMIQADLAAVVDRMRQGVTATAPVDAQIGWNEHLWQPDLASVATIVIGRLLVGGDAGDGAGRVLVGPAAAVGLASRALQIHGETGRGDSGRVAPAVVAAEALSTGILTGDRLLAAASKMAVEISVQLAAALARYVGFVAAGSLQRLRTGAQLTGTVLAGVCDVLAVTVGGQSPTMIAYGEQLGIMLDHIGVDHGAKAVCLAGASGIGSLDELYRLVCAAASNTC